MRTAETASGDIRKDMVGQPGIEPGTSVLSGLRSNRLSYWPGVGRKGTGTSAGEEWWGDVAADTASRPEGLHEVIDLGLGTHPS